jgi:hypothetical protein
MNCTLLERLQCTIELLEKAKIDAEKCQGKGNKSAGVRLRKICQEVREELKQIRFGVQQLKD